jgi:peptidoglycan/LPS O-acetylase OafA/YrhL
MSATDALDPTEDDVPVTDNTPVIGYLHEVDIVRLLTFASVIGVHAIAQSGTGENAATNNVEAFLHFTRDAFFALTGFVLFHTNQHRALNVKKFWKRRFPVVLVPYLVWSAIYFGFWLNNHNGISTLRAVQRFGYDLLTGSADYHLYFLLVSMQIYALFPVIRWVIRKTQRHHALLLAALFLADALFTGWLHYRIHTGNVRVFADNAQEMSFTYFVFVFGGAVAASHLAAFQKWVRSHPARVAAGFILAAAVAQAGYVIGMHRDMSAGFSSDPLQPTEMVWSVAMVVALYWVGLQWARRRRPGRLDDFVAEASRASFGVYLVHPLFLTLAYNLGFNWHSHILPTALIAAIAWLTAVVGAALFVEFFIRTPLAMPLTGRYRLKHASR